MADRESCSAELTGGRKRSRLAQLMACRAQEVLETHKVFRTPSLESLQASLMMVSLAGRESRTFCQSRDFTDSARSRKLQVLALRQRRAVYRAGFQQADGCDENAYIEGTRACGLCILVYLLA